MSDHQIAHVYVARPELIEEVRSLVASLAGVECVLDRKEQAAFALDHERSCDRGKTSQALGFSTLMNVIPLDAGLVRGSHGRITTHSGDGPVFLSSERQQLLEGPVAATAVKQLILDHVFA
jgi:hypothetical protein